LATVVCTIGNKGRKNGSIQARWFCRLDLSTNKSKGGIMKAAIGSISEGTLRTEDLIVAFTEELAELDREEGTYRRLIAEANSLKDYDTEEASMLLNEDLFDALNDYALPYTYFGTHEGDGSDFGFWVNWRQIEDSIYDEDLLKVNDLNDLDDYTGDVLEINDHGNVTLWHCDNGKLTEIWAVV